jgi:serine protease Do
MVSMKYLTFGMILLALATWRTVQSDTERMQPITEQAPVLPGRLVQESRERTSYSLRYVSPSRSPNQRGDTVMLRTFELAVGDVWKSTVRVMSDRQQLALGLIVDREGWIVTKASQLIDGSLTCQLFDGKKLPAELKLTNRELDLALLKIERKDLPAVVWSPMDAPPVGAWLATTETRKTPLSIGIVSVGPRRIGSSRPMLGISMGEPGEQTGVLVSEVVQGSGAYRAGIEKGDVILSINGMPLADQHALSSKISGLEAGSRISVVVNRGEKTITLDAQLMDLPRHLFERDEMEVNGSISARSGGFTKAFQHDTVLLPHQCGGPLIDSHGRVVGINIARAGRVNSYALPLDVVVPAVRDLISTSKSMK